MLRAGARSATDTTSGASVVSGGALRRLPWRTIGSQTGGGRRVQTGIAVVVGLIDDGGRQLGWRQEGGVLEVEERQRRIGVGVAAVRAGRSKRVSMKRRIDVWS